MGPNYETQPNHKLRPRSLLWSKPCCRSKIPRMCWRNRPTQSRSVRSNGQILHACGCSRLGDDQSAPPIHTTCFITTNRIYFARQFESFCALDNISSDVHHTHNLLEKCLACWSANRNTRHYPKSVIVAARE